MAVEFVLANEDTAKIITELRHEIWCTTYRGIYSDERIDNYDYEEHRQRDLRRIQDSSYHVYLITNKSVAKKSAQKSYMQIFAQIFYTLFNWC